MWIKWRFWPVLRKAQQGFGLLETITAMALFLVIVGAASTSVLGSYSLNRAAGDDIQATLLAQEGVEATRAIRNQAWSNIVPGTYGLQLNGTNWELVATPDTTDGYTRQITIEEVQRDGTGAIVATGGTVDPDVYRVISNVEWQFKPNDTRNVELLTYLMQWDKAIGNAVGAGRGQFCASQVGSGTNVNVSPAENLQWAVNNFDNLTYSYNPGAPTQIVVEQAGDFMLSGVFPFTRTDTGNSRSRLKTQVLVNGGPVSQAMSQSSHIRNFDEHNESSNQLMAYLPALNAGDVIEVQIEAAASLTDVVQLTGQGCVGLEQLSSGEDIFSATATQSELGTDLNQAESNLVWNSTLVEASYSHTSGTPSISFNDTGQYAVWVNIPYEGTVNRGAVRGRVKINGALLSGGLMQQGFVRNSDDDGESSLHWFGSVNVNAGDTLSVSVEQAAGNGTFTVVGNPASLVMQRLPSQGVMMAQATALSGGTDWNPVTPQTILWDQVTQIDPVVFTHSTTANSQVITVEESGDVLLAVNAAVTAGAGRPNSRIKVLVDGAPVSGAEVKTMYIRGVGGHDHSSSSMVYLLPGLSAGNQISVEVSREADTDALTLQDTARLLLWHKNYTYSLVPPTPSPSPGVSPSPTPSPVPSPTPSPTPTPPGPAPQPTMSGTFTTTTETNNNWCGFFTFTNNGPTTVTNWEASFDRNRSTITSMVNMTYARQGNSYIATPNASIQILTPGSSTQVNTCGSKDNRNAGVPTNIIVTPLTWSW